MYTFKVLVHKNNKKYCIFKQGHRKQVRLVHHFMKHMIAQQRIYNFSITYMLIFHIIVLHKLNINGDKNAFIPVRYHIFEVCLLGA